jgi:hypothetical protein
MSSSSGPEDVEAHAPNNATKSAKNKIANFLIFIVFSLKMMFAW